MALTQGARNKIKSFVQAAKKLLMNEFESQLQQHYGIRPDGSCLPVEDLTAREASVIETARLLRQRLHYLEATIAGKNVAAEAVRQLIREQAFTVLNRFAAVRMSEERNIIRESVRKGFESEGFLVFDQLTGDAKTAERFTRYKWYMGYVFDELSVDLPAVFDRFSPYALLFPAEGTMLELLAIINDENLDIYRESGHQPINLWTEDETIGWIYQYYNSREEISEMRKASESPRNSRELAVRNQFFTPRYVVQFLVDNSLGRQWYEMNKGQTALKESCQYMVRQQMEIFLEKGELIPETKIEGANYVEFRALKDPRDILFLDPACGSMHFGLYGFDLFEQIYLEAWDNHPNLFPDLREQYLRADFIKEIPGFILRYNIHGVDIDPRALQIAGLSLWLRAQKSFDRLNLQAADRPAINKSNLVIAEAMPGDKELLSEFTRSLPGPIGKLVRIVWEKMQLAGETGLLLKIEEELKKEIEIAQKEYEQFKNASTQSTFFGSEAENKVAEMAAIYGKSQKISKDFFDTAEEQVLKALRDFAENAAGEDAFQKLLFAEDTARGFAFIELCRKKYDVIVMNPPFGAGSLSTEGYFNTNYPSWGKNILCCFFSRMNELGSKTSNLGAIFDKTVLVKSSYEEFRSEEVIGKITSMLDTGWGVLDANVETSCLVLNKENSASFGNFLDLRKSNSKDFDLDGLISNKKFIRKSSNDFRTLPNKVIGYDYSDFTISLFKNYSKISAIAHGAKQGHALKSDKHFRNFYELTKVNNRKHLYNGYKFSMFIKPSRELTYYTGDGSFIKQDKSLRYSSGELHLLPGVAWGKRDHILDSHILRPDHVFTVEGNAIPDLMKEEAKVLLSYLNSSLAQFLLNTYCGQHKYSGYVNLLPINTKLNAYDGLDKIIEIKREWLSWDETTLEYRPFFNDLFIGKINFNKFYQESTSKLENDQKTYKKLVMGNDEYWINNFNCPPDLVKDLQETSNERPSDNITETIEKGIITEKQLAGEILSNIIGICFKRWDERYFSGEKQVPPLNDYYDSLPLINEIQLEFKHGIGFIENSKLGKHILKIFRDNPRCKNKEILEELVLATRCNSITDYLGNHKNFFDHHFNRYNQSRRVSPIYWPIATKSNSFIIWLYYPALNDNTLFSVVNELVDPKIKEIAKEVGVLEIKGSAKELNDQKEFLAELEQFKEELLRVAALPYKPNQDDGVLITATPLHSLFRHPKWKKDTQDCWKELEKGEYDWAHLAYSIWPERVLKKCKKDLSMAIAHGLEEICEVKPKKKKEKKEKKVKKVVKKKKKNDDSSSQLNFE